MELGGIGSIVDSFAFEGANSPRQSIQTIGC